MEFPSPGRSNPGRQSTTVTPPITITTAFQRSSALSGTGRIQSGVSFEEVFTNVLTGSAISMSDGQGFSSFCNEAVSCDAGSSQVAKSLGASVVSHN